MSRLTWGDRLPGWLDDLAELRPYIDELQDFARSPFSYVWALIIDGLLFAWAALLSYLQGVIYQVAIVPARALTGALVSVIATIGSSIAGVYIAIGSSINAMLLELGIAAPIALVIAWAVPAIFTAALVNLAFALVETYLPVEPITDPIRRVIRR